MKEIVARGATCAVEPFFITITTFTPSVRTITTFTPSVSLTFSPTRHAHQLKHIHAAEPLYINMQSLGSEADQASTLRTLSTLSSVRVDDVIMRSSADDWFDESDGGCRVSFASRARVHLLPRICPLWCPQQQHALPRDSLRRILSYLHRRNGRRTRRHDQRGGPFETSFVEH